MSLIKSQKRKTPEDEEEPKNKTKKKKAEPKKKLPLLVEGEPYQRGHRIFGWHLNKFTNERTLRPCEVVLRRTFGSLPIPVEEGEKASDAESSTTTTGSTTTTTITTTTTSSSSSSSSTHDEVAAVPCESSSSSSTATAATDTSTPVSAATTTAATATTSTAATATATTSIDAAVTPPPQSITYNYYVHFLELNRRNDCWLKTEALQIKDQDGKFAPTQTNFGANSALQVSGRQSVNFIEEAGHDKNEGMDEQSLREHEEITKVKNVEIIELGKHRMETWYFSPYPPEYFPDNQQQNPIDVLYICEFTLQFFKHKEELRRHYNKNPIRHPPGNEIYRDEKQKVSMFEVDGAVQQLYCQNLCWLGKLFLDHKTLYFDVDPFMFYILTEFDERGYHIVGFYSKEKLSDMGYNLACILTLPAYQRKGYGKFLIEFSYALSKIEGKVGSPEKPLSDLGQLAYYPYWEEILLFLLAERRDDLSIMDICKETAFKPEDVIGTLQRLNVLRYYGGNHVICFTEEAEKQYENKANRKKNSTKPRVIPHKIHWTPITEYGVKGRDKWAVKSKISSTNGTGSGGGSGAVGSGNMEDPNYELE